MFKRPGRNRKPRAKVVINLVPIMDGVFIVVFFLLITASSNRSFKIQTDLPVVKQSPEAKPKEQEPPLALTLNIKSDEITLTSGSKVANQEILFGLKRNGQGLFEMEKLHQKLVELKSKYPHENVIVFQVAAETAYEEIISLMDTVRELRPTDQEIYFKNKNGQEEKAEGLFTEVVFGNLLS